MNKKDFSILVVDDDRRIREMLSLYLKGGQNDPEPSYRPSGHHPLRTGKPAGCASGSMPAAGSARTALAGEK